jgi:hypothetical protein
MTASNAHTKVAPETDIYGGAIEAEHFAEDVKNCLNAVHHKYSNFSEHGKA